MQHHDHRVTLTGAFYFSDLAAAIADVNVMLQAATPPQTFDCQGLTAFDSALLVFICHVNRVTRPSKVVWQHLPESLTALAKLYGLAI